MIDTPTQPIDSSLIGAARIGQVEINGRTGWLKRPEKLGLSLRLRKGDPQKGFEREKQTYLALQGKGLPVADLLAVGEDYFVTADAGIAVNRLRRDTLDQPEIFHDVLCESAVALARLHGAGYCHGRPALKDICWNDGRVTFIDLDRTKPGSDRGYALDVLVFFFNAIAETGGAGPEIRAARDSYRQNDPDGHWDKAVAMAARLRTMSWPLKPLTKALNNKKEFRAITPFLRFMATSA